MTTGLAVGRTLVIPRAELTVRFSRSSGPGGQGVNTTDSRVELAWDVASSAVLSDLQRERLVDRLIAHDKPFDALPYPGRTHGIFERTNTRRHLYGSMTRWLREHLPAGAR